MKLLPLTLAAAMVMAATGCETTQQKAARMEAKGLVRTQDGKWVPKGTRFFGSGHPWVMPDGKPATIAFDPTVFNQAMAQNFAPPPAPVIVTGTGGSGVTMASQVGNTTIVSQFGGNNRPMFPAAPPIIDTRSQPIYYTEPIQQP